MDEFRDDYNRRLAREPQSPHDSHWAMLARDNLGYIFSWQEERRLTLNLTPHFKRVMYVIEPSHAAEVARGKRVLVREAGSGHVVIEMHACPQA